MNGLIDPNWQLVDLDPFTWRAIGEYFHPTRYLRAGTPDERALFVLHADGALISATDSGNGQRVEIGFERIDSPAATALSLRADGDWDRVHVINRSHMERVASTAQTIENRALTLDAYYHLVYGLVWDGSEGYVAQPPHPGHWQYWRYSEIVGFANQLPQPCSVALGVVADAGLEIGLIAVLERGRIQKVTTFEALSIARCEAELNEAFAARLWHGMTSKLPSPAVLLLCNPETFNEWLTAEAKREAIDRAVSAGTALFLTLEGL